ncbi:hypothetical protein QOZ80_7AG0561510 [Eleusine coracana subsp. coracana]|nr:hypothetical protein QOZ80_7BG0594760 [Eleusine coracana subsp. coracana]KAK3126732.1 hypothetical protein QOZ80_7AG0561510 [Eleusine coracana subsp. coracana]
MSTVKKTWPELLGWPVTPAVTQINKDRPDVSIEVRPISAGVPTPYNPERVCVYFEGGDPRGIVAWIPIVG